MAEVYSGLSGRGKAWKFLLPSLLGMGFFLLPIPGEHTVTIPLAVVADHLTAQWRPYLPATAMVLATLSALVTLFALVAPGILKKSSAMKRLFDVSWPWVLIRVVGAVFAIMALFKLGPDLIHGPGTGGVLLNDLAPIIIVIFLVSGLLIPLLTDYGLMELVGVLIAPAFRRLFRSPGKAAIDALASWMGGSTVGTLITIEQYRAGVYTGREAANIVASFSICSIGFAYALAATVNMSHMFPAIYGTVIVTGLIAAFIICRIPPISTLANTYVDGSEPVAEQLQTPSFRAAWDAALKRAESGPGPVELFKRGAVTVAFIYFGLLPSLFAIGGVALILAEATPLFDWVSAPLVPLLNILGLPDATAAAPAFVVGIADQFLTVIVGAGVASEQTRFVIAVLAVTQIIYFSELGALLLQSPIPMNVFHIAAIFILRTLIVLPVAAGMSHLFF